MNLASDPLFGVLLTVIPFFLFVLWQKKVRWLHPLFFTSVAIILFLWLSGVDYQAYKAGGDIVQFFLGPATVALAVPLARQIQVIRQQGWGLFVSILLGSIAGILSAGGIAWLLGATPEVVLSMLPKSVTSPISLELSRELGGIPGLTAAVTVLAGLLGNLWGYQLYRLVRIRRPVARGIAMGTAAHGIGTARALQESPVEGGLSSLAMGLAGIITSLLLIPVYLLL